MRPTRAVIDTEQLATNLNILRQLTHARMLLVVKANAYGHGATLVSRVAQDAQLDVLGVATVSEAVEIRDAGVTLPILVIAGLSNEDFAEALELGLEVLAWRADQFAIAAAHRGIRPRLHLDLDTGMARSGIAPEHCGDFLQQRSPTELDLLVSVTTHLWSAAARNDLTPTIESLRRFGAGIQTARGFRPDLYAHAANSAAFLRLPESHFDLVRMGITAYGQPASRFVEPPAGVKPIFRWETAVTNLVTLQPGEGASYDWQFVAEEPCRVASIPVGYGDGLHPFLKSPVLLGGKRTEILGRVMMDQCIVRAFDDTKLGDSVVIVGTQGDEELTPKEVAASHGTNTHHFLSGISPRVPRVPLASRAQLVPRFPRAPVAPRRR